MNIPSIQAKGSQLGTILEQSFQVACEIITVIPDNCVHTRTVCGAGPQKPFAAIHIMIGYNLEIWKSNGGHNAALIDCHFVAVYLLHIYIPCQYIKESARDRHIFTRNACQVYTVQRHKKHFVRLVTN